MKSNLVNMEKKQESQEPSIDQQNASHATENQPGLFTEQEGAPKFTEVKNASASGLGSMGRTDGQEPDAAGIPT